MHEISISGAFSKDEFHSWITNALPDTSEKANDLIETETFSYYARDTNSYIIIIYSKNRAKISSNSLPSLTSL